MEYKDLSNGVLSNIGIVGRDSKRWIDGYGENFGRDDMYLNIRGGIYDLFSARFYSNWIPHNLMFNGVTPFIGCGQRPTCRRPSRLRTRRPGFRSTWGTSARTPVARSNGKHSRPGTSASTAIASTTSGTKVGSASNGTSPGNGFTDLVLPVQYTTDNISGEFGYATSSMTLSASYLYSRFSNDNSTVTWNNPFFANGIDTTYLRAQQQLSAPLAQRDVAPASVEFIAGGALYVGPDQERLADRPERPERHGLIGFPAGAAERRHLQR